jgi:four helix bundle protein
MAVCDQVIQLIETLDTSRRHYRLFEQLEAAVTSIPMNIAEGTGANSRKNSLIFIHCQGFVYETLTLLEII